MSTLGTSPARSLRVIQCALLIAVTLLVCDQAISQESTSKESERIKGVATFLLDRANEVTVTLPGSPNTIPMVAGSVDPSGAGYLPPDVERSLTEQPIVGRAE